MFAALAAYFLRKSSVHCKRVSSGDVTVWPQRTHNKDLFTLGRNMYRMELKVDLLAQGLALFSRDGRLGRYGARVFGRSDGNHCCPFVLRRIDRGATATQECE
jgi:hypothetical protein